MDRRGGREWLDIVVAIAAICISLASLWVALRTDRTQERLLTASVWPVMLYESSDYVETGNVLRRVVRFDVTNAGIGPMRVEWFDMYYHDRPMASGRAFLDACCAKDGATSLVSAETSDYMQGRVLAARETIHIVEVRQTAKNADEYRVLDSERNSVYVRSCYCSALNDCWIFDSRMKQPVPTRDCPNPDTPLFQG
jgi:hypothetical protein